MPGDRPGGSGDRTLVVDARVVGGERHRGHVEREKVAEMGVPSNAAYAIISTLIGTLL